MTAVSIDQSIIYRFEGSLTTADHARYIDYDFEVPEGAAKIEFDLTYSPHMVGKYGSLVTIIVCDPHGFRGTAHRRPYPNPIYISPESATPGLFRGPLYPGHWKVQVAVHAIAPQTESCEYRVQVKIETGEGLKTASQPAHARPIAPRPVTLSEQPGWYRGELHSHTQHSDGKLLPHELLAQAKERGIQFIALTDHNTASAWSDFEQSAENGILILPGTELTTFSGHAVTLGLKEWVDWRIGYQGWTIEQAVQAAQDQGGCFIIGHPNRDGAPLCSGCHWDHALDPRKANGMEVWSGPWRREIDHNPLNVKMWHEFQDRGIYLTGTCGCDFHKPGDWHPLVPASWVYAKELSVSAISEGIRQGRVLLSVGPWLDLKASSGALIAGIGDSLKPNGPLFQLIATWKDAPSGSRLKIVSGTCTILDEAIVNPKATLEWTLPTGHYACINAELYDENGDLLALTNPIYFDRK